MAIEEAENMVANGRDKLFVKGVVAGMYKLYRKVFLREEKFDEFFDDFLDALAYIDTTYAEH